MHICRKQRFQTERQQDHQWRYFACNICEGINMDIDVLKKWLGWVPKVPSHGMLGISVSPASLREQIQKLTSVRSNAVQCVQALSFRVPGNVSTVCIATTGRGQHVHSGFLARWSSATLFVSGLTLFRRNVPQLKWLLRRLCLTSKITTYGPFQFLCVLLPEKHCVCWTPQGHWWPEDKDCCNFTEDNAGDVDGLVEQFSVML
jgi:hypothetical protein